MADTMGHTPDKSASATRNSMAALAVVILAVAPQLIELLWSFATSFGVNGRNPGQVLAAHGSALLFAAPNYLGGASAKGPGSDALLALIYSYPLFAIAVLTLLVRSKGPQDYFGGVALIALALFALWASSDLQGMRGFSFGAGTAPRMFGILLLLLGVGVALVGLLTSGPDVATFHWRGPFFVMAAILTFAGAIRPLGLVISAFAAFMIAALGSAETRWKEAIIVGMCLTLGCSLLFPYALGLPLQLFPRFLNQ